MLERALITGSVLGLCVFPSRVVLKMNTAPSMLCVMPGSATSSRFHTKISGALVETKSCMQGPVTVVIWILIVARDKIRNVVLLGAARVKEDTASGVAGSRGSPSLNESFCSRAFSLGSPSRRGRLSLNGLPAPVAQLATVSFRLSSNVPFLVVPARIPGLTFTGPT